MALPNFVYKPVNTNIKVLMRNYKLSDDVGFRFLHETGQSSHWPQINTRLDVQSYAMSLPVHGLWNLWGTSMDRNRIFEFLKHLQGSINMILLICYVSEAVERYNPVGDIGVQMQSLGRWRSERLTWLGIICNSLF